MRTIRLLSEDDKYVCPYCISRRYKVMYETMVCEIDGVKHNEIVYWCYACKRHFNKKYDITIDHSVLKSKICKKCGSMNIRYHKTMGVYKCNKCGHMDKSIDTIDVIHLSPEESRNYSHCLTSVDQT